MQVRASEMARGVAGLEFQKGFDIRKVIVRKHSLEERTLCGFEMEGVAGRVAYRYSTRIGLRYHKQTRPTKNNPGQLFLERGWDPSTPTSS